MANGVVCIVQGGGEMVACRCIPANQHDITENLGRCGYFTRIGIAPDQRAGMGSGARHIDPPAMRVPGGASGGLVGGEVATGAGVDRPIGTQWCGVALLLLCDGGAAAKTAIEQAQRGTVFELLVDNG